MLALLSLVAAASARSDAVIGLGVAVVTAGAVFAVVLMVGFAVLIRRARSARKSPRSDDSGRRANIALVRLDDAVASSADELGFAVAQFGEDRAAGLAEALRAARANLAAAFALKQQLDDATPDSATQQREWNARILTLCETTSEKLAAERAVFDELRGQERAAPQELQTLRRAVDATRDRIAAAVATLESLTARYAPSAIAPVANHPSEAARLLDSAANTAEDASVGLHDVGAIAATVHSAERDARRAVQLLDDLDRHASALHTSSVRLTEVLDSARDAVERAKRVREDPPDPATGSAVADAVTRVERTIAGVLAHGQRTDPDAAIARIEATTDALDTALAGARNQQQRLSHAREALDGALLTARSQIETTKAYIRGRRGGAGAEARTRLAEAERLLSIAEAEADPVVALDTARSSATYSRDADALARYDLLH
ncbi:MAG TPA: hypothetical protein VGP10_04265 [Marisediminicola sp.]|nr:hypothetical protein [Marisediminicola sp.]